MCSFSFTNGLKFDAQANPKSMVFSQNTRFTVLTSRVIRMEFSSRNEFEDRPSQIFWYRNQETPIFEVIKENSLLEIVTDYLHLRYIYDAGKFTGWSLSIELINTPIIWHYGDDDHDNLKGTARTLDQVDGATELNDGLLSKSGWCLIDDTNTLIFNSKSVLEPRKKLEDYKDLYFFGYGRDYSSCLKEYTKLAGNIPLIPRWALGNWWSRYWAYSQKDIIQLMMKFQEKKIPLSVCIIDMDWHIVNIREYLRRHTTENWEGVEFHSGWTGFTWNKDLFPDYRTLLKKLHSKQLKVALNLHPAQGIAAHEAVYPDIALRLGLDAEKKDLIPFDCTDINFISAYFDLILHPYEEEGIDFWWLDWQQGSKTAIEGLDPLWWLNHLHFYNLARGKDSRPFIFSRYGGLGNHRYQIGFSGDTYITWESLAFQPYFNATASNVCYPWWSNDIGGHMGGIMSAELFTRWVQLGVFSPIFRLHATKHVYIERLPWKYGDEVFIIVKQAMKLRHALIPYLYSFAWKTHTQSVPLIQPLYYLYPDECIAYQQPNQYFFGSELLCCPITAPIDSEVGLARVEIWLPQGKWYNFFTGDFLEGGKTYALYYGLEEIPVFAKAGAIVPLAVIDEKKDLNCVKSPSSLEIIIFPGDSNSFYLFEDDGETNAFINNQFLITEMTLKWQITQLEFSITPLPSGNKVILDKFMPNQRNYRLVFRNFNEIPKISIFLNNEEIIGQSKYDSTQKTLKVNIPDVTPRDNILITLRNQDRNLSDKSSNQLSICKKLLPRLNIPIDIKQYIDSRLPELVEKGLEIEENLNILIPIMERYLRKNELNNLRKGVYLRILDPEKVDIQNELQIFSKEPTKIYQLLSNYAFSENIRAELFFGLKSKQIVALMEIIFLTSFF